MKLIPPRRPEWRANIRQGNLLDLLVEVGALRHELDSDQGAHSKRRGGQDRAENSRVAPRVGSQAYRLKTAKITSEQNVLKLTRPGSRR